MNSNYRKKNYLLKDVLVFKINLKKIAMRLLPDAERWYMNLYCQCSGGKTVYSNPGLDLHRVQGKNEIATKFIQNV